MKVACIRDAEFFATLERDAEALRDFEPAAMQRLIHRCAELHMNHRHLRRRLRDGSARPLDFGHWSAHKLEQLSEFKLRHGEAVAVGLALDSIYSRNLGHLDAHSTERILTLLETMGFDLFANELLYTDSDGSLVVLNGLEEFREHLGGELTITLLQAIGRGFEVHEMCLPKVHAALEELRARHERRDRKVIAAVL